MNYRKFRIKIANASAFTIFMRITVLHGNFKYLGRFKLDNVFFGNVKSMKLSKMHAFDIFECSEVFVLSIGVVYALATE